MAVNLYRRFDSITAFNKYLEENEVTDVFKNAQDSQGESSADYSFTKTHTFAEARQLILFGDKKLAKKLDEAGLIKERAKIYRTRVRRQLVSSVVGAVPNVPAYIANCPNSMITYRQHKVRQKVVNVAYNCAVYGGVSAQCIIDSSVKLLLALMRIEAAGTNVNLYAVNLDETSDGRNSFSIRIKTAGQKFDVLKMAYPIAHPSMNRRHKFRYTEVTEGVPASFKWGYGCPETCDETIEKHFRGHGLKLDKAFNNYSLQQLTIEQIIEKIMNGGTGK